MSAIAINKNTLIKGIRPKYTLEQRTVKKDKNESVFVPLNQLPEELIAKISEAEINISLTYSISEDIRETELTPKISVGVGINTGRLFRLSAQFKEGNASDMLATFVGINRAIVDLKNAVPRKILRKNYELILMLTQMIEKTLSANRKEIEEYFDDPSIENFGITKF